MKRLFAVLFVLCALFLVFALLGSTLLEKAIVAGVETVGPKLTDAPVTIEGAELSVTAGSGSLNGLVVGNPEGFSSEHALSFSNLRLDLVPSSLLSDKIVIEELIIDGPEVVYEAKLGSTNIGEILNNVQGYLGTDPAAQEQGEGKRFEVRRVSIVNGKVRVIAPQLAGQGLEVPLPPIEITDIGTSEEGATLSNVVARVLASINAETVAATLQSGGSVGKQLQDVGESLRERAGSLLEQLRSKEEGGGE